MQTVTAIDIEKDTTIEELLDDLGNPCAPMLLLIGEEILYPDEMKSKILRKGDKVHLIWLIAGG